MTIEQAGADLDLVALGIADRGDRGVTVEATRSVTLPATAAGRGDESSDVDGRLWG